MAKPVDARDLKSLAARYAGSSPAARTILKMLEKSRLSSRMGFGGKTLRNHIAITRIGFGGLGASVRTLPRDWQFPSPLTISDMSG